MRALSATLWGGVHWLRTALHGAFWEPISPRPLAVFRIAISLILLAELMHLADRRELFFLPLPLGQEVPETVLRDLWLWGAAIAGLGLGVLTPLSAGVTYWFVSKYLGATEFRYHVDLLYLPITFLLIVLPSNRVWSVDRLLIRRFFRIDLASYPIPRLFHTLPIYWVMGFMYFDSTLYKLRSPFWLDGLGFWLPASFPQFTMVSWNWLLNQELLVKVSGYITLIFELVFLFVFWIPRARRLLLPIGVVLHLGIAVVLPLPLFGLTMVILFVLFFPDAGLNRWLDVLVGLAHRALTWRPGSFRRARCWLPSKALAPPAHPFLRFDRLVCLGLCALMVAISVVQSSITFDRPIFSQSTYLSLNTRLGLASHHVFGHWQFSVMKEDVAVVYYDAEGREHWLPWIDREGHVGSAAYSRFWTWWWLVSLPGNPGTRNSACARVAEEWAKHHGISLEDGRVVIKVRTLITGHFWEKDRHAKMERLPWLDTVAITWPDGAPEFDAPPPPALRPLAESLLASATLPLGQWRAAGIGGAAEPFLLDGWSWPEDWGRWNKRKKVTLALPQAGPPDGALGLPLTVELDVLSYTEKGRRSQPYRISVEGTTLSEGVLGRGDSVISFTVPAALSRQRIVLVEITLPKRIRSSDGRMLALALKRLRISRAQP
jgi:Vitamin K-dependent gamma-carboxylase